MFVDTPGDSVTRGHSDTCSGTGAVAAEAVANDDTADEDGDEC